MYRRDGDGRRPAIEVRFCTFGEDGSAKDGRVANLILVFTMSFMLGFPGSARMLRLPRARGPHSNRPEPSDDFPARKPFDGASSSLSSFSMNWCGILLAVRKVRSRRNHSSAPNTRDSCRSFWACQGAHCRPTERPRERPPPSPRPVGCRVPRTAFPAECGHLATLFRPTPPAMQSRFIPVCRWT